MQITLIVLAIVIPSLLVLACLLLTLRAERYADAANECEMSVERTAAKLMTERARVTVVEREVESLRRELRKLGGTFYAFKTKLEDEYLAEDEGADRLGYGDGNVDQRAFALAGSICDNWSIAQRDGPTSEAASCECAYCVSRRAERRALREALVPKTVQHQAELARLNAGKP